MVLRKSFYIRWSAGRSPRVHEVNPGRDPSTEVGESSITGPDLIRDTSDKVGMIRKRLFTAQSRQKSYADVRRRPLEFKVGDHVFLKVMPKRGVIRFGKRGKLSSRYIGPFEVL